MLVANIGVGLNALVPVPAVKPPTTASLPECSPGWLDVLSKGVSYIPEETKVDINGWDNQMVKERACTLVRIALEKNDTVLVRNTLPAGGDMDTVINYNKAAQFLLESIKGRYIFNPVFPEVTYDEDPSRARMFHDLSTFLLNKIIKTINDDFVGFSTLDIKLLNAAEGYLRAAISTNENALILSPEKFRDTIVRNIGAAYNNLGLVLNLRGDMQQARKMYEKALRLAPDDRRILENMEAIHKNASYIRQQPFLDQFPR